MVDPPNTTESGQERIPTARDVVSHLNVRLARRGLPYRIEHLVVLPYVNPMWLANWEVPELSDVPEREIVEEELRDARWLYPQIVETP